MLRLVPHITVILAEALVWIIMNSIVMIQKGFFLFDFFSQLNIFRENLNWIKRSEHTKNSAGENVCKTWKVTNLFSKVLILIGNQMKYSEWKLHRNIINNLHPYPSCMNRPVKTILTTVQDLAYFRL